MADETNPRSLDFQLRHLADLYGKLPRHAPEDLQTITNAAASLRNFNLQKLQYSGADGHSDERQRLNRALRELEKLLPAWSNNLSHIYFSHARTLPITIGE